MKYLRKTYLGILSGLLSGLAATLFLYSLDVVTHTRELYPQIVWGLPVIGFFIGWMYHRFGTESAGGNSLILEEIHDPKKVLPISMAPLVYVGTLLTHLFGGSAGREGTAVQMGASLSDQLSNVFKSSSAERKTLLMAGAGAGFGAAIGTPIAGILFGLEVTYAGRLTWIAWWECLVSSFVAYGLAIVLRAPHSHYPHVFVPAFDLKSMLFVALGGVIFGLAAYLFSLSTHVVERQFKKQIKYPPLRPALGGLILILLFWLEGSGRFEGLGIEWIQQALEKQGELTQPILKSIFTTLTVGTGFKGGEFIPLVYIGTTLGSALGAFFPTQFSLLAATGFAAVFGAAAKTPLACSVMAMEIFGWEIAPYALVACFVSFFVSGSRGIYTRTFHSPRALFRR